MPGYLRVRLDLDDGSKAGIAAKVKKRVFWGEGEAWFNLSEIQAW